MLNNSDRDEDDFDTWYKIIKKLGCVYTLDDTGSDIEALDKDSAQMDVSFLIQQGGTNITDKSDYITEIINEPQKVLQEPCSAFLLDIDPSKAQDIQNKYGVICQSTRKLKNNIWTKDYNNSYVNIGQGKNDHSWKDVFPTDEIPRNSLIIIDRYLFSNYDQGLHNLEEIVSNSMPLTLAKGVNFHVLLIYDPTKVENSSVNNFKHLSTELNSIKNRIRKEKDFFIDFEVLAITKDDYSYDDTHNRRIISNYFIVSAEHMLKAFSSEGNGLCNQVINCNTLFSRGLDTKSKSDMPNDTHISILENLSSMVDFAQNKSKVALPYSLNGNSNLSISNIKNRIINCL